MQQLEKQTITPVMQNYDVCEQLVQCAISYEPALEKKNLEFDADMEDYAEISADPDLMELVWNNLFSNAVKFTEPGGKITLTERSDGNEIYVSVTDTGCGMTEETKKHIFEKFYQGDTSHATAGNGLGLALVLRVLQLNNYKIEDSLHEIIDIGEQAEICDAEKEKVTGHIEELKILSEENVSSTKNTKELADGLTTTVSDTKELAVVLRDCAGTLEEQVQYFVTE